MILTIIDWCLGAFNLLVNIWLFISIYRSGEVSNRSSLSNSLTGDEDLRIPASVLSHRPWYSSWFCHYLPRHSKLFPTWQYSDRQYVLIISSNIPFQCLFCMQSALLFYVFNGGTISCSFQSFPWFIFVPSSSRQLSVGLICGLWCGQSCFSTSARL